MIRLTWDDQTYTAETIQEIVDKIHTLDDWNSVCYKIEQQQDSEWVMYSDGEQLMSLLHSQ